MRHWFRLAFLVWCFATCEAAHALDVNGQLKNAQLEKAASDPVSNLVEARVYWNTTSDQAKIYDGDSWELFFPALANPMDSAGDLIVGGSAGVATKLDAGTTSQVLVGGTTPAWSAITNSLVDAAAAIDGSKIVSASASVSGVVTTSSQTFAGDKTFSGATPNLIVSSTNNDVTTDELVSSITSTSADAESGGTGADIRVYGNSATGSSTRIDFYTAVSGVLSRRAQILPSGIVTAEGNTPFFIATGTDTSLTTDDTIGVFRIDSADASNTGGVALTIASVANNSTGASTRMEFSNASSGVMDVDMILDNSGNLQVDGDLIAGDEVSTVRVTAIADSDTAIPLRGIDTNTSATNAHAIVAAIFSDDNDATGARFATFQDSGGQIGRIEAASATTVAYQTSSDERLKYDFREFTGALDIVRKTKPSRFKWKENGQEDIGFGAQSLKEVYPYVVSGGEDLQLNPMAVDYGKLTPLLTAAIKELIAEIDDLKAEVALLRSTPNEQGNVIPIDRKRKTSSLMPNFKKAANQ